MISIIIPTYNEESSLPELISYLLSTCPKEKIEIIISDGGSTDNTVECSSGEGVIVLRSPKKGRATQMNYGASVAKGEVLYFLHADSYPPKTLIADIEDSIGQGNDAGCYKLAFDDPHPVLKFYSWFTKFDIDYFRFGDQSLFIKKEIFKKLSGFDEHLIVMEDQVFVRRVKFVAKFEILNDKVVTSARKYRQVGMIKLQLIFSAILILFYLGVPQKKLQLFYRRMINI